MKSRAGTLDALLREQAGRRPDRPALVSPAGHVTSYGELDRAVGRLAGRLARLGLVAGDRIVVQLPNCVEFILLIFALFRLGVIPVLALPGHRRSEIDHLCKMTEAVGYAIPRRHAGFDFIPLAEEVRRGNYGLRHILVEGNTDRPLAAHSDDVFLLQGDTDLPPGREETEFPGPNSADLALLLLSGGTTGTPKLIPRTHRDYVYNVTESAALCGLDEAGVYLAALPVAHNFALGCPGVLGTLAVGGTVVLAPDAAPDQLFPLIERQRVTVSALTPPLLTLWLAEAAWTEADLSSLRLLQVGGARLSRADAARVGPELGCRLQQVFGMAEGLLCFTRPDDPEETVFSTQGRPLAAADELRVVDGDDHEVAPGDVGRLLVRGPYTIRSYYRAPEYDATAFTTDGYYRTGDLVRITPTGHLVVEGRVKDVINRGGEKVPAAEVEDHLSAHPLIAQVALVGMPDGLLGERTCAYVVPQGTPPALGELAAFLRGRGLAAYKLPDRLEVVDVLPRTGVGKVDKRELATGIAAKLRAERLARA
ncbi:AMP-binding protein [Kitasatospora sp. MAP5-34]|uniref:(2,3-dihydroxybenzoyl)adenylate synthase n=1 Tax=Kitasatospora sp. MAP5-34 TaxID=3035102 RepID=UPI002474A0A7|nr:AMP-binding protein [Kitasatospora sp. MAP5-34]MDH6577815.1 2,3-dihydroxybenzoate-AMP ligase [Kitasatospora sp. MAP5-34]